jgi:probable F420-dependent oxidoreductase
VRPFRFALQGRNLSDRWVVASDARQAEDLGYEELYSYDHIGAIDPFLPLIVAAEATSTLRVGPLVLNNELNHPALLARTVATADRMTNGRVILGIGTGYAQSEHEAVNIELRPPGPRVERLEETLLALRSLLDQGTAAMTGTHHRLAVADLGVRPIQEHVPVLVGGHGRRLIDVAGRLADIFQFTGLTHGPDGAPGPGGFALESVAERSRWLTEAAGARSTEIERSILVQRCLIGEDTASASDGIARDLGLDREVVDTTPFLLFGSKAQIVDRLESLRESIGVSHVVVREATAFAPVVEALGGV